MTLEKLTIGVEGGDDIEVMFNPSQFSISKSASWKTIKTKGKDVPASAFSRGEPATLSLELFFDTYGEGPDLFGEWTDVREYTNEIVNLTTIENHGDIHRPPLCTLHWGKAIIEDTRWILTSLTQNFTLFVSTGDPVRATLSCSFQQWRDPELDAKLTNKQSADVPKIRTVRQGDTLSRIASVEYKEPALWRVIAEANGINNPLSLSPGQVLTIPRLTAGGSTRR